jgi:hypothetical protein
MILTTSIKTTTPSGWWFTKHRIPVVSLPLNLRLMALFPPPPFLID